MRNKFFIFALILCLKYPYILGCHSKFAGVRAVEKDSGITLKRNTPADDASSRSYRLASLELTKAGVLLLQKRKPDDAIDMFERAISVDPEIGRNYYYMAEAWRQKGNQTQALQFHRLAIRYLNEESTWRGRLSQQGKQIQNMGP